MRWAQEAAGARIVAALPLESQWLANHLLVLGDGRELVLRRWARPGWEVDDPDLTAAREVLVLERLADTQVPAPELVAADPDAAACDVPALLLTRLPGAVYQGRPPVGPLVAALAEIQAVDPSGIPPYRRYHEPDRLAVPPWAGDRDVWERAIALAHAPAPELPERFIHRDFHPGNTLWGGAELTGVVDWTTGSPGPAAVRPIRPPPHAARGRPRAPALAPRATLRLARGRRRPPPPRAPPLLRRRHRPRRAARPRRELHQRGAPAPRGARGPRARRAVGPGAASARRGPAAALPPAAASASAGRDACPQAARR